MAADHEDFSEEDIELGNKAAERLRSVETPDQQAVARAIFDRLRDGAEVEDVEDLIKEFTKLGISNLNAASEPAPEQRVVDPAAEDETDWGFKWNEKGW